MFRDLVEIIWEKPLIVLIIAVGLGLFTGQKLYKMSQIRGWIPGAQVIQKTITDTATGISTIRRGVTKVYYVAWDGQSADAIGPNRINVDESTYMNLWPGKELELLKVPRDNSYYLRDGIYADISNFTFDIVLFIVELALVVVSLVRLLKFRTIQPAKTLAVE